MRVCLQWGTSCAHHSELRNTADDYYCSVIGDALHLNPRMLSIVFTFTSYLIVLIMMITYISNQCETTALKSSRAQL